MKIKSLFAHSIFNAFASAVFVSCLAGSPVSALVIIPTFDSTVSGDPNAANIEAQVNTAIKTIDGLFSTPVTVNISVGTNIPAQFLAGFTFDPLVPVPYATYVNALTAIAKAGPSNTMLATALQYINVGNGGANKPVVITYANAQALGLPPVHYAADNVTLLPGPPQYDATIQFNSKYFSDTATPSGALQAVGVSVAEHELSHALGAALSTVANQQSDQYNGAIDLYRYSGVGTGSLNFNGTYFSIDGGNTKIAPLTDDGHFDNSVCLILSASICNTTELYTTASPEYTELLALGYDPVSSGVSAVPEPSTWVMMVLGFVSLGFVAYRKKNGAPRFT